MKEQIEKIIREVAEKHELPVERLLGRQRSGELIPARVEIAVRLRNELKMSYPQIGRAMGRDHSSIMYYIKWKPRNILYDAPIESTLGR